MSQKISKRKLLDFLAKAHDVCSEVRVVEGSDGYCIKAMADWDNDGYVDWTRTRITFDGTWEDDQYYTNFFEVYNDLTKMVEEKYDREIIRQKREAALARLTKEEKELLGLDY